MGYKKLKNINLCFYGVFAFGYWYAMAQGEKSQVLAHYFLQRRSKFPRRGKALLAVLL